MIGRADIEGSKSDVAMNAWPPQASYPCGNFSGTSSLKPRGSKGSIGHTFMVCIHTENQNQGDFYPFVLLEISVLHEPPLGHLRYGLTDVPPQPNSPPDDFFDNGFWAEANDDNAEAFVSKACIQIKTRIKVSLPFPILPNERNNVQSSGISLTVSLPPILYLKSHFATSN